ncbi:hypothetical protein E4T66_17865 [Sinimarinibacterium sp. CAU 1509]|uniref:hypothetical protein n=1 Tax=Sinimarinibacterium sp. CAU 1509 TaxID=2562283 RepID=UPI0010ACFC09|nr:hypothetical protein [Sinimarinibacterium sp. CAU 1509]TJY57273.1 hypothetical protein E4T66_17865 [Sinimarinibacterium sp. CAU 1509]
MTSVSLITRFAQHRTLTTTGRLSVGQRSLFMDATNSLVWGVDEYGCDQIVSHTDLELDWMNRAIDWINVSHGPALVPPAEFVYT